MADDPLTPSGKPEDAKPSPNQKRDDELPEPSLNPSEEPEDVPSVPPETPSLEEEPVPALEGEPLDPERLNELFLSALNDDLEQAIVEPPDGEEEEDGFEKIEAGPTEEIGGEENRYRRRPYRRQGGRRGPPRDRAPRPSPVPAQPRAAVAPVVRNRWRAIVIVAAVVAAAAAAIVVVIWLR